MRYYSIIVKQPAFKIDPLTGNQTTVPNPSAGQIIRPPGWAPLNLPFTYGSYVNGQTLPSALNVEMDIFEGPEHLPTGDSWVRVWGISLAEIAQASNINGMDIEIYGGMAPGLPLATAAAKQAGLLVSGSINRILGNWIGLDQTLDMFITAPFGTNDEPANIVLNWPAGTPLSAAISSMLSVAFPTYLQKISISQNLIQSSDQPHYTKTLTGMAQFIQEYTRNIIGGAYPGVWIVKQDRTIIVSDSTTPPAPKQLAFTDFIGQPTWINAAEVQFKTTMRADLEVQDEVLFPTQILFATNAAGALPVGAQASLRDKTVFQGKFLITNIHHVGNYRQPDAESWNTTFNATVIYPPTSP